MTINKILIGLTAIGSLCACGEGHHSPSIAWGETQVHSYDIPVCFEHRIVGFLPSYDSMAKFGPVPPEGCDDEHPEIGFVLDGIPYYRTGGDSVSNALHGDPDSVYHINRNYIDYKTRSTFLPVPRIGANMIFAGGKHGSMLCIRPGTKKSFDVYLPDSIPVQIDARGEDFLIESTTLLRRLGANERATAQNILYGPDKVAYKVYLPPYMDAREVGTLVKEDGRLQIVPGTDNVVTLRLMSGREFHVAGDIQIDNMIELWEITRLQALDRYNLDVRRFLNILETDEQFDQNDDLIDEIRTTNIERVTLVATGRPAELSVTIVRGD